MSMTGKRLAPQVRSEADKLRIIAELDAVPDDQKRAVAESHGVSPLLVMSWKHDLLGPGAASSAPAAPDGPPTVGGRDGASYQLEIAMLKEDNRRLRRALAALLGEPG